MSRYNEFIISNLKTGLGNIFCVPRFQRIPDDYSVGALYLYRNGTARVEPVDDAGRSRALSVGRRYHARECQRAALVYVQLSRSHYAR